MNHSRREASETNRKPFGRLVYLVIGALFLGGFVGGSIAFYDGLINSLFWKGLFLRFVPQPLLPLLPFFGLSISVASLKYFKVRSSVMSDEVIQEYHHGVQKKSFREMFGKYLSSVATIGFGASAGMEGAAKWVGANTVILFKNFLSRYYFFQKFFIRSENLLLIGGAAGIAAVLKAPLAGAMMGIESPYRGRLSKTSFIPAVIASFASAWVFKRLRGAAPFFAISLSTGSSLSFKKAVLTGFLCIILGIVLGLYSRFFLRLKKEIEVFAAIIESPYRKALIGGISVAVCAYLAYFILGAPMTLQSGYPVIERLIKAEYPAYLAIVLLILKMLATILTFALGGVGGYFVPTATLGACIGSVFRSYFGSLAFNGGVWVLLAVSGITCATYNIFWFGIVFVAELTLSPWLTFCGALVCLPAFLISKGISNSKYQID